MAESSDLRGKLFHYTEETQEAGKREIEGSPAICVIMLSGISQTQKDKYRLNSFLCEI